ncbi:ABC transporter substrate-binding protein [Paenarthrobacter sp. NPDC090522]|uniref:ABC transporter substrate-binding protein n=1 Tax=Paenarthrobacter sp. NPDC090522 TaxID=3364383 RepID=UPI0038308BBC
MTPTASHHPISRLGQTPPTRRNLLTAGIGAAALLALTACAENTTANPAPTTHNIQTTAGSFTVPINPSHIVCVDYFTAIFVIELGLEPAGGIDYSWVDASTMYPDYLNQLKNLPNIGEITSTNFEKVANLHADLILGPTPGSRYDNSKGALSTLTAVAPVASVDFGQSGDWRGPFEQTAALVNRKDKLQTLIDSYTATANRAKADYQDLLSTTVVSVVDYSQTGNFALDLPKSAGGVVLGDLGVRFGTASIDDGTNTRELSLERLEELSDSDIILYRAGADGQPGNGLTDVVTLEGWKNLPAVRAGHAYPIGWADLCTYRWAESAIADFTAVLDKYRQTPS